MRSSRHAVSRAVVIVTIVISIFGSSVGTRDVAVAGSTPGTPAPGTATPAVTFPVTTTDCFGRQLTFTGAPSRIVTLDGYAVEFLLRLGLGDRIVGTGFPLTPDKVPADLAGAMAAVPVLGETDLHINLSTEQIAAARPDLILTTYPFMLDATFAQRRPADVLGPDVQALTACNGTPGASREGIEPTYQFIDQLGQVFGVRDRSDALVASMRARQADLAGRIPAGTAPRVMLLGGIPDGAAPVFAWGGASFPNGIVTLAGGRNVFGDLDENFFSPSPEDIAVRDPELIVIVVREPGPPIDEVVRTLRADPTFGGTTAAREGRVILLSDALIAGPTARNLDGVERIVDALYGPPAAWRG